MEGCGGGIGGKVYIDANLNGMRDTGELPLSGATVTLQRLPSSLPAFGALVRSSNFTTMNTPNFNGRGIAYDGHNYWITHDSQTMLHKLDNSLAVVASYSTAPWRPYAISWDPTRTRIWAVGTTVAGVSTLRIWGIDPVSGLEIPNSGIPMPSVLYTPDGMQHDPRSDTFWISNDQATIVYHLSLSGAVLGSFTIPFVGQFGNTGIGFDGCHLWLMLGNAGVSPVHNRYVMVTDTGQALTYFDYFNNQHFSEDIEVDAVSAAPDILLWGHSCSAGYPNRLKAWSIGRMWRVTQTDNQGNYGFSNLLPGQYSVRQSPYFGYVGVDPGARRVLRRRRRPAG